MNIVPFETAWHLISAFIVFFMGFLLILKVKDLLRTSIIPTIFIYLWHSFFSIVYMYFTLTNGGDSIGYYNKALEEDVELQLGTQFIEFFSYILISTFGFSYLELFLFFNIFGSIGLLLFYASIKPIISNCSESIRRLSLLIIFLPSVSFWSSALGKDSISFFATALALWAALNLPRRKVLMAIAIIAMLSVRPHIAGIMIMALGASLLISTKQISLIKRLAMASIVLPIAIILVPFAANYAGIENITDITEVNEYVAQRQGYNMEGGSGIDISSMSLPMQIFTYLFRPLPYEAYSIFVLFSSLDNLILLLLFLYAIIFVRKKSDTPANHAFLWLYVIISVLVLSMTTANLGISVRQKWMFMPMLIYLLFAGIAAHQAQKQRKKTSKMQSARFYPT